MPRYAFALAAAVALASAGLPTTAAAQKGGGADSVTLRVCNNASQNARVAISYQPVGQSTFLNEGWFEVRAGTCEDLARTTNAYMYGYANVAGNHDLVWAGDHPLCVQYPGPYEFWTTSSPYCETYQESRNFQVLHAQTFGVYTWNLDP